MNALLHNVMSADAFLAKDTDTMRFTLQPDTELLEHLCENNRDLPVLERYWRGQEQAAPSKNGKP